MSLSRSVLFTFLVAFTTLTGCATKVELRPTPGPAVVDIDEAPVAQAPTAPSEDALDQGGTFITASDDLVAVSGRAERTSTQSLRFGYPGVTTRVHFVGTSLIARLSSSTGSNALDIRVDGEPRGILWLESDRRDVAVAVGLGPGRHTVDLTHRTETRLGVVEIERFALPDGGRFLEPPVFPKRKIMVIGASVVCGQSVARGPACEPGRPSPATWDARATFGMVTGRALNAEVNLVCYGGRGLLQDWTGDTDVLNGPDYFELAVPDGDTVTLWDHEKFQPDVIIVGLGNNDFNRDLAAPPKDEVFVEAYVSFLQRLLEVHPTAQIWITDGPVVRDAGKGLAKRKTLLQKYLTKTVKQLGRDQVRFIAGNEYPGDSCDAHPTASQHRRIAGDLIPEIRQVLEW